MIRQEMYIHGNAVTMRFPGGNGVVWSPHTEGSGMNGVGGVAWSDIVGLHQDFGVTYRGRAGQHNFFMVAIPTPCRRRDNGVLHQALLDEVGFTFESDEGVEIQQVGVFDNRGHVTDLPIRSLDPSLHPPSLGGLNPDFVLNRTLFAINPTAVTAVALTFKVFFAQEGNITFFCAGATFQV